MMTKKTMLVWFVLAFSVLVLADCKFEQKNVSPTLLPTNMPTHTATPLPSYTATRSPLTATPRVTLTPTPKPVAQNVEIVGHIGNEATRFAAPVSTPDLYLTRGLALRVAIADHYAFVLQGADGPMGMFWGRLNVLELSNPIAPSPVGLYQPDWIPSDIVVISHTVYLTDGQCELGAAACWGGLHILDVSTPSAPTQVGAYKLDDIQSDSSIGLGRSWFASGVVVTNNLAYITGGPYYLAEGDCGLRIVDVSKSTEPKVIGKLRCKKDKAWSGHSLVVQNDLAYIAAGQQGLHIVSVANPSSPTEVGHWGESKRLRDVKVEGHLAYLAVDDAGLQIVDVSKPTTPREVSSFKTPGSAWSLALAENYVYLAAADSGLRVIDISDPSKPTEIGFYQTSGSVYGVTVANGYIYMADTEEGLLIAQLTVPAMTPASKGN